MGGPPLVSESVLIDTFRSVIEAVPAEVSVLTLIDDDGRPHGMTISSLVGVTYEPPSILVCVGRDASSRPYLTSGRRFCVNLLASDQAEQSVGFAYGDGDPFVLNAWAPASHGTPVLEGTAGHLMCRVENVVEFHGTAVVLAVVDGAGLDSEEMLIYRNKRYFGGLIPVAAQGADL